MAKVGQSAAQAVFIFLGLALVVPRLAAVSPWLGWLPWVTVFVAATAAVAACAAFVWTVRRGFWVSMQDALGRVRLGGFLPPSWAGPGRDLDAALARLGPGRAVAVLGFFVLGWAVGAAEIYLILHWVGAAVDWRTALALETGSVLIDGMLFFVPAKVGTQEGGKVVLFAAFGLSPARGSPWASCGASGGGLRRARAGGPRLAQHPPERRRLAHSRRGVPCRPDDAACLIGPWRCARCSFTRHPSTASDGGAGARYQARREIRSFSYPPGWPSPLPSSRGAGWWTPRPTA